VYTLAHAGLSLAEARLFLNVADPIYATLRGQDHSPHSELHASPLSLLWEILFSRPNGQTDLA
jgi:hypothetical protein